MNEKIKYPDVKNEKIIALDTETKDPFLKEKGSGVYRKDGNILGFSLSLESGFSEYYNIGHKDGTKEEKEKNLNYLKAVCASSCDKLFANVLYDMDWIENGQGIKVNGKLHDVQIAEPLIDEYAGSYSLDYLGEKYLNEKKYKTEIDTFCERRGLKGDSRKHLYLMDSSLVRPYAKQDTALLIPIFNIQENILSDEELLKVYEMEMKLIPLILQMRKNGVRIDEKKRDYYIDVLSDRIEKDKKRLFQKYGMFNCNSSKQIAAIFDGLSVSYGLTEKGNPKLDKDALQAIDHPIVHDIIKIRETEKIVGTFLKNALTDFIVDGRIHTSLFPLRTDENGTVSGRFSSARPNLQQTPKKDDIDKDSSFAEICRGCFIPEDGLLWGSTDLSQIEYRIIAHYATGPKSEEIRRKYNGDPETDYHKFVMDISGLDRSDAKRLNFGKAYFMGIKACSRKFGWTIEKSSALSSIYDDAVPFVKTTRSKVVSIAKNRGYIKTIMGRRARVSDRLRELKKEYVMFNRLIQGSAADYMKLAMLQGYEAGIYNVLAPHFPVHDEMNVSIPRTKEGAEAFEEQTHIMENCYKLKVPVLAKAEIGKSWGEMEDYAKEKLC